TPSAANTLPYTTLFRSTVSTPRWWPTWTARPHEGRPRRNGPPRADRDGTRGDEGESPRSPAPADRARRPRMRPRARRPAHAPPGPPLGVLRGRPDRRLSRSLRRPPFQPSPVNRPRTS